MLSRKPQLSARKHLDEKGLKGLLNRTNHGAVCVVHKDSKQAFLLFVGRQRLI